MTKTQYTAPQLVVASFRAEKGYAASSRTVDLDQLMFWRDGSPVETYEDRNNWGSTPDDNHFWN